VVLAVVLLTANGWLLAGQAIVFALGALLGPRRSPYGLLFRSLVATRLGPPTEREAVAPVRFAQRVGLAFALVGTVGFGLGAPVVGLVATGFALVAAFLNAAFGICLGCLLYLRGRLLLRSLRRAPAPARAAARPDTGW
jgi:hypothetical protein